MKDIKMVSLLITIDMWNTEPCKTPAIRDPHSNPVDEERLNIELEAYEHERNKDEPLVAMSPEPIVEAKPTENEDLQHQTKEVLVTLFLQGTCHHNLPHLRQTKQKFLVFEISLRSINHDILRKAKDLKSSGANFIESVAPAIIWCGYSL